MPEYTITDIVEAINKLDASKRSEIIAKLSAAAAPAGQLKTFSQSVLAAAGNPKQLIELKELRAMAKRHSIELPENERIDLVKINKQLDSQEVDISTRMTLKAMLARAGMIEH
jgi:hypothetical protein